MLDDLKSLISEPSETTPLLEGAAASRRCTRKSRLKLRWMTLKVGRLIIFAYPPHQLTKYK